MGHLQLFQKKMTNVRQRPGGGGGGMGMFGIDRAIKNKDVWFSFHVLMQKVIFFSEGNERLNVFALAHGILCYRSKLNSG